MNRGGADIRPFLVLAAGLLLWWFVPGAARLFVKRGFTEFQAPVLIAQSHLSDLRDYWERRLGMSRHELIVANKDLAEINAGLQLALLDRDRRVAENQALLDALRVPPLPAYRTVVARVARRDVSAWWKRLVVRRGSADGIVKHSPVVAGDGYAVGVVTTVELNTSEVLLVSDPAFRVSVNIEGENERSAVFEGAPGTRPFDRPRGRLTHFPVLDGFVPESGARLSVYTSGSGGIFPPGLVVGTLDGELTETPDGLFLEGGVLVHQRLYSLDEVSILVPTAPVQGVATDADGREGRR
ncbi:MAG: rod shape-determining protein MreC [Puniceicoccales bacterium]|jgi:cell shape-determining protein MreC|nr:rod shape-determining protein MreC [Puniceicoccales bacterium]